MARTLVQALEGISFPCDRTRIVEYARGHDVSSRALEYLEQLPEQQYRDMTELFSALPAKSQRRPRLAVVGRTQARPEPERQPERQQRPEQQRPEPEPAQAAPQPDSFQPFAAWAQWQSLWLRWFDSCRRLWFPWSRS